MTIFTITAPPIVEPYSYTASGSNSRFDFFSFIRGSNADPITEITSASYEESAFVTERTSSNGDKLTTIRGTSNLSAGSSFTFIEQSDATQETTQEENTNFSTQIESWNGQLLNIGTDPIKSDTTTYSNFKNNKLKTFAYEIYTEGGTESGYTTTYSGTTGYSIDDFGQQIQAASTITTSQSYAVTIDDSPLPSSGVTYESFFPTVTRWQTQTIEAQSVFQTQLSQGQTTTVTYTIPSRVISTTSVGTVETTTSIINEGNPNLVYSVANFISKTGATGFRGTHTVAVLGNNETLWVPSTFGVKDKKEICRQYVGPATITLSTIFLTRNGRIVNDQEEFTSSSSQSTLTRTILTISNATTTSSYSFDGMLAGYDIPTNETGTYSTSFFQTTSTTTESTITENFGNYPTDTIVAWRSSYISTENQNSTYNSLIGSFKTITNTRRFVASGSASSSDSSYSSSSAEFDEYFENSYEASGNNAYGQSWTEHRNLFINNITPNARYATITTPVGVQTPLNNLNQFAKKVSIQNTTIKANLWDAAYAASSIVGALCAFPQETTVEDTDAGITTIARIWADGYRETLVDSESSTTNSGGWIAQGTPDTQYAIGNFENTGKNLYGKRWTRIRFPNILIKIDSNDGSTTVTFSNSSKYEAAQEETFINAEAVEVVTTNASFFGGNRFL